MRLSTLIFILLSLALNAKALEVILNPYGYLDYYEINSYSYPSEEEKDCECPDYSNQEFDFPFD